MSRKSSKEILEIQYGTDFLEYEYDVHYGSQNFRLRFDKVEDKVVRCSIRSLGQHWHSIGKISYPSLRNWLRNSRRQQPENEEMFIASEVSIPPCNVCGGEVREFSIPNPVWNVVVRKDGHETDKEYLCVWCFLKMIVKYVETKFE